MQIHKRKRNFKCQICDFSSKYRASLFQHEKTHKTEKGTLNAIFVTLNFIQTVT